MMRSKLGGKTIWYTKGGQHGQMECIGDRLEEKFVNAIAETVVEVLQISYKDRSVFTGVLKTAIADEVQSLLEQYLNGSMDTLIHSFNYGFGVDAKPNYDYAPHAKLSDAIDMVIKKYDIKVDRGNITDKTRPEASGKG